MKKLVIDQKDLFFAYENRMPETNHYLNLETGEVIPVFAFNRKKLLAEIKMYPEKYLKINPLNAKKSFQMMEDYIETVPVPKVRKELKEALLKKGAFRSFRAVVDKYSEEKQLWLEFKRASTLKQIKDWLAKFDIELVLASSGKKYHRR